MSPGKRHRKGTLLEKKKSIPITVRLRLINMNVFAMEANSGIFCFLNEHITYAARESVSYRREFIPSEVRRRRDKSRGCLFIFSGCIHIHSISVCKYPFPGLVAEPP